MGSKVNAREAASEGVPEALAAGDHGLAIEILLAEHGDYIYGYCRRLLGNPIEAEDVAQTVFTQALQDLGSLTDVHAAQAWLRGIARHRCLDRLRARRRDFQIINHDDLRLLIDRQSVVGHADRDPRVERALDECMDCLDARSRQLLVLRYHDGLSFEEISRLTSDTPGALRVRLTRALPALRRCLERKGVRP